MRFRFAQFDEHISISLFENVKNAPEIRRGLMNGDQRYDFAFVEARNIVSIEQLKCAVYRALNDSESDNLRTRTIHAEILFCLSPLNNIMDSLRRFGISDESTAFYAVKVGDSRDKLDECEQFLKSIVAGDEVDVNTEHIKKHTDLKLVKKNYKVDPTKDRFETTIVNSMVLRGYQ